MDGVVSRQLLYIKTLDLWKDDTENQEGMDRIFNK